MKIHTTVTITKTNYLLHLLTCGALFQNSVLTKVVIAKHSTCKENHFGKLNGGLKHTEYLCSVGKQIDDKSGSSDSAFPMLLSVSHLIDLYSCDHFLNPHTLITAENMFSDQSAVTN